MLAALPSRAANGPRPDPNKSVAGAWFAPYLEARHAKLTPDNLAPAERGIRTVRNRRTQPVSVSRHAGRLPW
jgi:hypothetical protein